MEANNCKTLLGGLPESARPAHASQGREGVCHSVSKKSRNLEELEFQII